MEKVKKNQLPNRPLKEKIYGKYYFLGGGPGL
jgi:hypothetical protein